MSVLTQQPAPPTAPEFGEEPSSGSGNRRTLLLVGGVLAALAAAAAAYFFLFSGSGSSTASPTAVQPPATAPKSAPSSAPSAGSSKSTPPTSAYQVTKRDPFAPLPTAGAASTTTKSSSTGGSTGAPTPAAPIAAPITFILASVDAKAGSATLSVDGTSYSATVGKVFAKNYMLYAVFNATCAGVLVGDQSVPLCVGHSVAVTP